MAIRQNISDLIRLQMEVKKMTFTEYAKELEISRSALQQYAKGEGNPSVDTLELLAGKMGCDPIFLLTGAFDPGQKKIILRLLETIRAVAEFPEAKRQRFAELVVELVHLFDDDAGEEVIEE